MNKKINLAMRGGGVKSAVGLGALVALRSCGVEIAAISGTSIASCAAAMYVSGISSRYMLYFFEKYVTVFGDATLLGKSKTGSSVIEEAIDKVCGKIKLRDIKIPIVIPANAGGLWNTRLFVFSQQTTPNVTLGQACRASSSFPVLYGRYKMNIDGRMMKFYDGGMVSNPFVDFQNGYPTVVVSYQKEKTNYKSRYLDAWKLSEENADELIKPYIGKMKTLGTAEDIYRAFALGYEEVLNKKF